MGSMKEPHRKYLRKPCNEDEIARAQARDNHRLATESLRRQLDAMKASNPFGKPTSDEISAERERIRCGRYRWGKMR